MADSTTDGHIAWGESHTERRTTNRCRTAIGVAALVVAAAVPAIDAALPAVAAAGPAPVRGIQAPQTGPTIAPPGNGATAASAGASCWGIKQQYPASATGTYWLSTASLDRPGQYYCDMTTDGGGWVLVGRGRNGWTFGPGGQSTATAVRTTVDGTSAFAPAALDTPTINGLLDNADLTTLPGGIRLERALNTTGTTRQDFRMYPTWKAWKWSFDAGQLLNRVVIDGTTYNGSNTRDTNANVAGQSTNQLSGQNNQRRMFTMGWASHNYVQGFALGSSVSGGSNSSTNYLWTSANEGSPLPFTRVWIRPQIPNQSAGYTPIPEGGFAAQAKPAALKSRSEFAPWGVVGYNHTGEATIEPWNTTVLDIRNFNDRIYVGGRFTGVQQGPSAAPIAQQFLAMFDLDGNWISTFRPTLDGRVWDMAMTADGKLIVAGDFTNVNGAPDTAGMAALNPLTGAVITTWRGSVSRTDSSARALVRAIETRGNLIYAAGRFNRVTAGTSVNLAVPNTVSLNTTTGQPGNWRPQIGASAADLAISAAGDRVYMAGFFNAVNGDTNMGYHAVTNISDGTPVAGIGPWIPSVGSGTKIYQQAVGETDGNIIVGGSQHDLQKYDHNRTTMLDSHITKSGGDIQTIETFDGWVYAGCHCMNFVYQGTNEYSSPRGFRSVDNIRTIGRWNAATFEYDDTFVPTGLKGTNDEGAWGIAQDSRKCLWIGGDYVRGAYSGNAATDWLGGIARFCPEDATPPSAPSGLSASVSSGRVALTWAGSADDTSSVTYDVYRNDRIIATVSTPSFTDTTDNGAVGALRYTVRASDSRGNRSASPPPISLRGPATTIATPIAYGATWRYRDDGSDQGTAWRNPGFADSSWASGPAVLGWGGAQTTTIGPSKPITTYFRTTFTVANPNAVALLDLQAKFTQGAVLYVNGIEAGRWNMPGGTVTSTTLASAYVGGSDDAQAKGFQVPKDLLKAGTNTMAVEVHGWRAGSGTVFFDLQAATLGGNGDTSAPTKPVVGASTTPTGVNLSWSAATDDTGVTGYLISRNGLAIAVVGAGATTYTDGSANLAQPAPYVVTAFDAGGNANASLPVTPPALPVDTTILPFGSTWKWFYDAGAPSGSWNADGYDDTSWASGAGELGFGDTPKATIITTAPAPRPLTSYYRRTVTVTDPTRFRTVALDLIRNSGAAVYVNGVEVARSNLPAGVLTANTYAIVATPAAERHVPVHLEIPASAFRAGTNTIAVELHLNYKAQPTAGFDLQVTGVP